MKTFNGIVLIDKVLTEILTEGIYYTNPLSINEWDYSTKSGKRYQISKTLVEDSDKQITFDNIIAELSTFGTSLLETDYDDANDLEAVIELSEIEYDAGKKYKANSVKYNCVYIMYVKKT